MNQLADERAGLAVNTELNEVIGFIWQRAADIETEQGDNATSTELRSIAIAIACNGHKPKPRQ